MRVELMLMNEGDSGNRDGTNIRPIRPNIIDLGL